MATPANETAAKPSRVVEKSADKTTTDAAVERVDLDGADLADRPDDNAGVHPTAARTTNPAVEAVAKVLDRRSRKISNPDLVERFFEVRGVPLNNPDQWFSKRYTAKIHVVKPTNGYAPTPELYEWATVLGATVEDILAEAADIVADQGIYFVPTAPTRPQLVLDCDICGRVFGRGDDLAELRELAEAGGWWLNRRRDGVPALRGRGRNYCPRCIRPSWHFKANTPGGTTT